MTFSLGRKLALSAVAVSLLLGALTWTAIRATRTSAELEASNEERESLTRRTSAAVGLTWIAAILFAGAGYFFFRRDLAARRNVDVALRTREQHEFELRALSLVDDLTGLHNRRGFLTLAEQQIKLARRNKRELVLLFIDMDDFKLINDRFGHQEGDLALQRAARVLRSTFRDSDIIARLGGDEFVVLAAETGTSASIIQRLRQELAARNETDAQRYTISFSVGAARFDPEAPPTIEELLRTADSMLYEQKRRRRPTPALAD
ncbi:MAG TPA: GGDEF domain-containing protein [Gemmatimonadaceae bacterium]|nr:GGDEF domain-containing protein [Gemmatimonadaceae bacterium]